MQHRTVGRSAPALLRPQPSATAARSRTLRSAVIRASVAPEAAARAAVAAARLLDRLLQAGR
ncbi:hypothetical protein [Streptacidiphilus sp. EB103A]|uniref:hypothetical protein n=1 Tax=Streptacidiphilus sp. EB103A TaxID=3156275 RepID=UPI003515394F